MAGPAHSSPSRTTSRRGTSGWAGPLTVWLLIMVGVLVVRLSVFRGLRAENRWVFEHGVPYSIHRSSVDYDDGETSGWPTYIALNHRLDFRQDRKSTRLNSSHVAISDAVFCLK